ncbi:zinc transporter ZupT [Campylobacter insulaenigrae]|uniref:Zinc transporter ZupT n=1 Tax=Campylobacter insulaenigrae TaxID=260714 RepID=A0ABY3G6N0_9BACT|nr:zinc transporter ZupT [Campylobacter insulaenigrae]MCR6570950.1 zinc transporter ZupT [Campylobacter insulaenigrae]MCR6584925.1 zinc transporter ZupT [Campylobacter insulaenigrae]TWO27436.1 zinc transporter ZupT [Campylobacter insulaenigrae]
MEFTLEQILIAMILTILAGISTAVGSIIAFFSKNDNFRFLAFGLGFSSGVMIYISFMEILPSAFIDFRKYYNSSYGELLALLCFFGGIFFSAIIDRLIPKDINPHDPKDDLSELKFCLLSDKDKQISNNQSFKKINVKALKRTGIFTALAIALHNFPEGFATFMATLDNISFGIAIAVAVAIHNIPEGIAVSLPIYYATNNKKKAFIYSTLSGIAEPIGAIAGAFLILPVMSELTLAITFAIIAAIMIFISFNELLPAAKAYDKGHDSLYGLVLGMAIMAISLILLNP